MSGSSARDKLKAHFLGNIGRVMGGGELRPVAGGISEWARRVRELRDDDGYKILTHKDRKDLKPGQYLLQDPVPVPGTRRQISKETRSYVLDRDGGTCQLCGAAAGEPHPFDGRKTKLHLGHIKDKSMGGSDEPDNLRAICSVCNEGAQNLTLDRPSVKKLLIQIRRATISDQREILDWLAKKFSADIKKLAGDG